MPKTTIDKKEVAIYEKEVALAAKYSTTLKIESKEDYESAMSEGKAIKTKLDAIVTRKEEMTKPLNTALNSVRALFKPLEAAGEAALRTIKDKMMSYVAEERKIADEAKLKLAQKVESGYMKPETAVAKMENIVTPEKTIKTEDAKSTVVKRKAYRVVDKSKIPLEFMEPNMVAIKQAFKTAPVEGVEEYEVEDINLY